MYKQFHGEYLGGSLVNWYPGQSWLKWAYRRVDGKYVDEVLRDYFPDYECKGVFFDIGAFEPITISNSHHFHMNGWDVYSFEANTELIPLLKQYRQNVFNYAICDEDKDEIEFNVVSNGSWTAGFSAIEISEDYKRIFPGGIETITKIKVPQRTLNTIINNEISYLDHIDIISIDIEGGELKCLYGIDLNKYNPQVILIENVTNDQKITNYLLNFGYKLDKQISYNQYYIKI